MQEGQHERLEAIETEAFTDLSLTSVVMMRARTERGALGDPARRADVRAVDTRSASMILCDFCEHFCGVASTFYALSRVGCNRLAVVCAVCGR